MSNQSNIDVTDDQRLGAKVIARLAIDKLRRYPLFLPVLLVIYGLLMLLAAAVLPPVYEATATMGPPQTTTLSANLLQNASGNLGGLASKLGGGLLGGGGQMDPYTEYTELLTTNRLAAILAAKKGFLQEVFYKKYDSQKHQWLPNDGLTVGVENFVRMIFHYPPKAAPNEGDLQVFLSKKMNVSTSLTSVFTTVTLDFDSPQRAQRILNAVLVVADNIVREEMRADVSARLAYLNRVLPQVAQSDERDTLTSLLSQQQQQMMVISADKLFASAMVDPSYASLVPIFPSFNKFFAGAIILAIASWAAAVFLLPEDHWLLQRFVWRRVQGGDGLSSRLKKRWRHSESW